MTAPWGMAAGTAAWCLAGAVRAARTADYPWNAWTPLGYGAAKGLLFGLLAGGCAALGLRLARAARHGGTGRGRVAGVAFTGGLLGGLAPGTVRDFTGPPQPATGYYFDLPRPEPDWYWGPLMSEWLTYTVLPAVVGALVVAAAAAAAERARRWEGAGRAALAVAGVALLILPPVATAGLPAPEGNGGHVNESAAAGVADWAAGLAALLAALVWQVRAGRLRG
ncbi:hypothetical protein AB0D08_34260 [Kitasatospora sp. NPDC048540]|uniref:hypothetical protein n=1 Tax=Kitasatospora sp. NPDC048540 TaxID=3155634 RepID=UPI0033D4CE1A